MDTALADRLQFTFTIMFHYLFPIGTMGIALFIVWYTYRALRYHSAHDEAASRFWINIFTLNFAAGVVTGIPMEFQFGTNWAGFSAKVGSVVGQPLALEGTFAFFLESIFLGVLLYGRRKVAPAFFAFSTLMVCLGSWLSGYFIVATDAWMQHPVGFEIQKNGTVVLTSLATVLCSPFALWQFLHVLCAALVAGGFILAGVGAFYLLSHRHESFGRDFVRTGVIIAAIFSALTIFPSGDRNGADVTMYQPIKLAAMEGLFESKAGAPLAIIGMPDVVHRTLLDPVLVPHILSFLAYGNFTAGVHGLNAYAHALWPPVELTYYAYHIMVGLGTLFIAVAGISVLLLWKDTLYTVRPMLWLLMLSTPFPYIANEAGWVVTEVGRQPWIVYGLMKTQDAVSPNVSSGETIFTLLGFVGMYFLLGTTFLILTLREIGLGPARQSS